jgi:hypothetical protein
MQGVPFEDSAFAVGVQTWYNPAAVAAFGVMDVVSGVSGGEL